MDGRDGDVQVAVLAAQLQSLASSLAEHREETRSANAAIILRLDEKINGKLDRHAHEISELRRTVERHAEQLKNLAREVFTRAKQATSGDAIVIPLNAKTVTAFLLAVAGIIGALLAARGGG